MIPVLFSSIKNAGLLKGAPDPRDYGGSDPINAVAALYSPYRRYHSYMKHYAELPHNDRGAYLKLSRGIQRFDVRPDRKDVPPGTYKLRIRVGAGERLRSFPPFHRDRSSPKTRTELHPASPSCSARNPYPALLRTLRSLRSMSKSVQTPRAQFGIQERQPKSAKILREEFDRHKQQNGYGTPPAIWVDWMELEGPLHRRPR